MEPWGESAQLRYWRAKRHASSSLKRSRSLSLPYAKPSKELPRRIACMVNAALSTSIDDARQARSFEITSIRRKRERFANILQLGVSNRDRIVQFMDKIRLEPLQERDELIETSHESEQSFEPCSICLAPLNSADKTRSIEALSCGHTFHSNCISTWFQYKNNCPIDRIDC